MKVSPKWLQSFFEEPLPSMDAMSDALTFHSCEIEEETPEYLDVKVLPDRAAYCLCHRGIAYELGAILGMPMNDPLKLMAPEFEKSRELAVEIEDESKCLRYMGGVVHGVKVGPSPDWLREALESVGQRSINNVVDATNYVMLDIGQPLHAFDGANLQKKDDAFFIKVRGAHEGEKITTLTGEEYSLPAGTLLITDGTNNLPIGIAGVKGGKAAQITEKTTDIIIESASFEGAGVRKTSQKIRLWTDASQRYQNKPSSELASYGMQAALKLITEIAGGQIEGVIDVYPESSRSTTEPVAVSLTKLNSVLGTSYTPAHVGNVFERLGFAYIHEGDWFTVTPPFERRDILIAEDLIEEIGRILGYEHVTPQPLPELATAPDLTRFLGVEHIKDFLIDHGYSEISTQTFAEEGHVLLANPLDQTRPALRPTLARNMEDALARAKNIAPRVLGPVAELKLFEIGSVFAAHGEHLALMVGYDQVIGKKTLAVMDEIVQQLRDFLPELIPEAVKRTDTHAEISLEGVDFAKLAVDAETGKPYQPKRMTLGMYTPFSVYPFALRDIAVWTPAGTEESEVVQVIVSEAARESENLLARMDLFDRFEKRDADGNAERVSYAFRLVFESPERTLSDEDLNPLMEKITAALNAKDSYSVR